MFKMYDVKSCYRLSNAILYLRITYTKGLLLKRSVLQLKFIEFISINFRVALPYVTKLWVVTNILIQNVTEVNSFGSKPNK